MSERSAYKNTRAKIVQNNKKNNNYVNWATVNFLVSNIGLFFRIRRGSGPSFRQAPRFGRSVMDEDKLTYEDKYPVE